MPNENPRYVVYKENTLGYIIRTGAYPVMGVLSANIHGYDWKNGPISILPSEMANLRTATQKDFDVFRVSGVGHLSP